MFEISSTLACKLHKLLPPLYRYFLICCLFFGFGTDLSGQTENTAWPAYGRDAFSSKYAAINQIAASNVAGLHIAWTWDSIDLPILAANPNIWTWKYEATPIMVDGVLYTSTSLSQVAAIDAASGQTLWQYNPESYRLGSPPNNGFLHRGVAYWTDGDKKRIFIGTGDAWLISLDATTGVPDSAFGSQGRVDLTKGLRRSFSRLQYGVSSPPVICRNTIIVGSSIWDYPFSGKMAPGDVRGFDPHTGEQKWVFHSVPQEGETGNETWEDDSWRDAGNTNVWAPMSCDPELGYVYLPFGTPTNDYYGGERKGDNLFAESLVCLDAATGERIWHYQIVHHGIWDYDLPAAPNLIDITVDGKRIKAVAQVTKQGSLFVFDRVTGEPVWPIEERPVPQSSITGEVTSATQPFPTKPAPYEQQGATEDDLIDFSVGLRAQARNVLQQFDHGPLFTPPTTRGTITVPGVSGGGSWAGAAVHPATGRIFVPSIKGVWTLKLSRNFNNSTPYFYIGGPTYGPMGPQGLSLMKPPYGRITAIDLNSGEHLWYSAVGEGPRNHSAIRHLNLPRLGWARRIFVMLSDSILFAVQEGVNLDNGPTRRGNASTIRTFNSDPALLAFDMNSGEQLAKIRIPSNAAGSPMTYMQGGKQYIVIPIGGASQKAQLVALTLEKTTVDVKAQQQTELETQVLQVFPNPAIRHVNFNFALPVAGKVRLTLYTSDGRLARELPDKYLKAGQHVERISLDGLPAGIFFCRIETEAGTEAQKLIYLPE